MKFNPLASITRVLSIVTPSGWFAITLLVVAWVLGRMTGWAELIAVAVALAILLAICLLLTIGTDSLTATLSLDPERVTAGEEASAWVEVRNQGRLRSMPCTVELGVGTDSVLMTIGSMRAYDKRERSTPVVTTKRGVIPIGPVTITRGDPFGLLRRDRVMAAETELCVHPRLVAMPRLNSGLIRDLEGNPTPDPSVADLDFHMLRDYVPGDDRRHVHWKSSARNSVDLSDMQLLMKQYVDTRRSHLTVILDGRRGSYRTEADMEESIVGGASISARAIRDEIDLTVVAARHLLDRRPHIQTMDGFARVLPDTHDLSELATRAVSAAPGMSVAIFVTGTTQSFVDIQRAAAHIPSQVRLICIRMQQGQRSSMNELQGMTVFNLGSVADLGKLLNLAGLT